MAPSLAGCGVGLCTEAVCTGATTMVPPPALPVAPKPKVVTDTLPSTMLRDKTAPQILMSDELALPKGSLPTGYRALPLIAADDEGAVGGSVTYGNRPTVPCGTTQATLANRIADCAVQNDALAKWDGTTSGNSGQGTWTLVTFDGTYEVWRDDRTRLIWSDALGATTNWCRASGSSGGGPFAEADPSGLCDNGANQNQVTPESWCYESAGLNTPGAHDAMKGGMRAAATGSSPAVIWRLPTLGDYTQSDRDGIRFAMPNALNVYWMATSRAALPTHAWTLNGASGLAAVNRGLATSYVRCVGHAVP